MRWPLFLIPLPLAACSSLPAIPAPWEPTETQLSEPPHAPHAATPAWTRIGSSVRGKPIETITLGSGPRRIYILGGIHGDEPEGPAVAAELPAALLSDFISEAGEKSTIRIVRDMNPDGTATGSRGNTRGIDLNRNWPSRDYRAEKLPGASAGHRPASELEVTTVQADMAAFKPDLVILFGTASTGRGPEVGFVGPASTPAYDFSGGARVGDPRWRVLRDQRQIVPGSLESLVGKDMAKPVLAVDFRRGSDTKVNVKAARAGIVALAIAAGERAKPTPAAAPKPAASAVAPVKAPILGGH